DEQVGAGIDFSDPNSPLAPLYMRAGGVAACALLAGIFVVACAVPLLHSAVWGHLKFGEWMVTHGRIPEHEPFCPWSDKEAPFVRELFLAWLLFVLGGPVLSRRALLALPVLFLLWVNCHGSFLIGLVVLSAFLAGRVTEAARGSAAGLVRGVWRDAQVRRLA